jgi:hypothetical protein
MMNFIVYLFCYPKNLDFETFTKDLLGIAVQVTVVHIDNSY